MAKIETSADSPLSASDANKARPSLCCLGDKCASDTRRTLQLAGSSFILAETIPCCAHSAAEPSSSKPFRTLDAPATGLNECRTPRSVHERKIATKGASAVMPAAIRAAGRMIPLSVGSYGRHCSVAPSADSCGHGTCNARTTCCVVTDTLRAGFPCGRFAPCKLR